MPLVATRGGASAFGLGWSAAGADDELGGMVLVTPTSIAYSGTSATIGANGSVEFTACTSLSLNGVFTGDYDNYMIVMDGIASTTHTPAFRLRQNGIDASGSSYTYQYLYAAGASVIGARSTATSTFPSSVSTIRNNGTAHHLFGPSLAQPTAGRSVTAAQTDGAQLWDLAWTHSISGSYDGFSLIPNPYNITGLVSVYGLVGA